MFCCDVVMRSSNLSASWLGVCSVEGEGGGGGGRGEEGDKDWM